MKPAHWLFAACCIGALAVGALLDAQRDRLFEAAEQLDEASSDLARAVRQLRHNVKAAVTESGAATRG